MNEAREINRIPLGMRPGRRELNQASLLVSMCESVPEHMREKVREITHVYCAPSARKQRLATALLNFVCQEADASGITLVLTVSPPGPAAIVTLDDGTCLGVDSAGDRWPDGPCAEELASWYAKFGFTPLNPSPFGLMMARQVSKRPAKPRVVPVNIAVGRALRAAARH